MNHGSILIVGGAGYIGSHLALHLHDRGIPFAILDNLEQGFTQGLPVDVLRADLRRPDQLDAALAQGQFETIFHFAAYTEVGDSARRPASFSENNIAGTINLLSAAVRHGAKRVIFSSTCATYGEPTYLPLDEQHPQAPINHYGWTKLVVERILEQYRQEHGLAYAALRYFNAAGADLAGRRGERHNPETHLIPLVIQAALGRRGPIKVNGTDYPTPDGTCIRDYIHVDDLADAHRRAADALDPGEARFYNLGTGSGHTVGEVIRTVEEVSGRPVPHELGPRREGDAARLVAANDKARRELGWEPRVSFRTIIESAWRWHEREQ